MEPDLMFLTNWLKKVFLISVVLLLLCFWVVDKEKRDKAILDVLIDLKLDSV